MCRAFLLAFAIFGFAAAQTPSGLLTLDIRIFLGGDEVTAATRVTLHRAGDRSMALAPAPGSDGRHVFEVPAGIYDAQAVREHDGRVLNIRWAERLVIMPYPDEGGRHLEVVNFTNGYGALQVKATRPGDIPELTIFAAGERSARRHCRLPTVTTRTTCCSCCRRRATTCRSRMGASRVAH